MKRKTNRSMGNICDKSPTLFLFLVLTATRMRQASNIQGAECCLLWICTEVMNGAIREMAKGFWRLQLFEYRVLGHHLWQNEAKDTEPHI